MFNKTSIIHTDFFGCFTLFSKEIDVNNPEDSIYKYIINNICKDILVPSFNYDYCKNLETSDNSKSQLGTFSEYFRKKLSVARSFDPVFSFCSNKKKKIIKRSNITAFDDKTEFGSLIKNNGKIIYIGTRLDFISTFIHHIELKYKIEYRYFKEFEGVYSYNKKNYKIIYKYHVWPKTDQIKKYDSKKINLDMINDGILKVEKVKNKFFFMHCNARDFKNYIFKKLNDDNYYLLTKGTKNWIKKKVNKLKRPFIIDDFES